MPLFLRPALGKLLAVNNKLGDFAETSLGLRFIQEAETSTWITSASPKTTSSFDVLAGDVLVAFAAIESQNDSGGLPSITASGGSLSWTRQEVEDAWGNVLRSYVTIWTATVDTNKSMTVDFTRSGTATLNWGGNVLIFRGSSGIGATNSTNNDLSNTAPSLDLTTTANNSIIVMCCVDWQASGGAATYDTTDAGTFIEQTFAGQTGVDYTVYGGYYANAGAAGLKTIGISSPTQRYVIAAVEVKP